MSSAARWTIVVVIAVAGLVAALLTSLGSGTQPGGAPADDVASRSSRDAAAPGASRPAAEADRSAAGLPACRPAAGASNTGSAPADAAPGDLTVVGVTLSCMADGADVPLSEVQAGTPMLLNLWAYWCEPCRRELPALRDAQTELGPGTRIVLAHVDPNEANGLDLLRQLGVTELPSLSDPQETLPLHFRAPPVLPVSVLVRADGSVAKVLPQPLQSKEEVVDVVNKYLGQGAQK